jgi:hypothetical protein
VKTPKKSGAPRMRAKKATPTVDDIRAKLLACDFEPLVTNGPQSEAEFDVFLQSLCVSARVAFKILTKSKAELIDATKHSGEPTAGDGAVASALLDVVDGGQKSVKTLVELMDTAELRLLSAVSVALSPEPEQA